MKTGGKPRLFQKCPVNRGLPPVFITRANIAISGVARNFWAMGHFPCKLLCRLGNNGQLKINWAIVFVYFLGSQTLCFLKRIKTEKVISFSDPSPQKTKVMSKKNVFTKLLDNYYCLQNLLGNNFWTIGQLPNGHPLATPLIAIVSSQKRRFQSSKKRFRCELFCRKVGWSKNGGKHIFTSMGEKLPLPSCLEARYATTCDPYIS